MDLKKFLIESVKLNRDNVEDLRKMNKHDLQNIDDETIQRKIHYILHPDDYDFESKFREYMKSRGLNDHIADIVYMFFDKYQTDGGVNVLMDYLFNTPKEKMLSISDIFNTGSNKGNVIDMITNLIKNKAIQVEYSNNTKSNSIAAYFRKLLNKENPNRISTIEMNRDVITKLAAEKNAGGIKVGDFEFLLRILLGDNLRLDDKRGDIVAQGADHNLYCVEVKAGSGRISSAKSKHAKTIRDILNAMLNEKFGDDEKKLKNISNEIFNDKGGKNMARNFFGSLYYMLIGKESELIGSNILDKTYKKNDKKYGTWNNLRKQKEFFANNDGPYMGVPEAQEFITQLIINSYISQWFEIDTSKNKYIEPDFKSNDHKLAYDKINKGLKKLIRNKLFAGDDMVDSDNKSDVMRRIIATISLCSYCLSEGFTHFLVLNNDFSSPKGGNYFYIEFRPSAGKTPKDNIVGKVWDAFGGDAGPAGAPIKIQSIQNETDNTYGKGVQILIGDMDITPGTEIE